MTQYQQQPYPPTPLQQYPGPGAGQPLPPVPPGPPVAKKRHGWVPWAVAGGTFLVGIGVGAAGGDGTAPAATGEPQASATVTATVTEKAAGPAPAAVTQTLKVPGPVTTKTVIAPPPGPKAAISEDGIFLVGKDIKPGTYRSGNDGDCYWARLRNLNGDLDSILANNNGPNQTVTIKKSDKAFETARCGSWTPVG